MTALNAIREKFPTTARRVELTGDDKLVSEDSPFDINRDRHELNALSLLMSVREPDLSGRGPQEIDALAYVHGDPNDQFAHCLRSQEDDEPDGSMLAVQRCREHLLETFNQALDGLGDDRAPDMNRREKLQVALGVRGKVDLQVPLFHLRMGAVLHAMQDSFTHLLRAPETDPTSEAAVVSQPISSLNWIDWINDEFEEARDGHEHLSAMDNCEDDHPLLTVRRQLAERASIELLSAAYDPDLTRDQKLAAATATLDRYLTFKPDSGCNADNRWCNAPELDVPEKSACGCQVPGSGGSGAGALGPGLAALGLIAGRRRVSRARRAGGLRAWARRQRRALVAAGAAALVCAWPGHAQAEEEAKPETGGLKAPETKAVRGFALYAAVGATVDKPAMAFIVAGRYRLSSSWIVGADVEWNPFYNTYVQKLQRGVFNGYGTLIRQYPLKYEEINLRTTVNLGTSILLQDLVGAPAGKPGIYAGISPLGVEWRLSPGVHLVFDPLNIALPFPQISGVPYGYRQYRLTVGIELG